MVAASVARPSNVGAVPVVDSGPAPTLAVLTPPVQALTAPQQTSAAPLSPDSGQPAASQPQLPLVSSPIFAAPSVTPVPFPQSVLPALPTAPVTAAVSSKGRLPRAQALPELPLAVAAARGQAGDSNSAAQAQPESPPPTQSLQHTIVSGETLSSIAASYGVSVGTVIANNPDLDDFDTIRPGQTLRVPSSSGLLYNVRQGDTLDDISHRYGLSTDDLIKVAANGLKNADTIQAGQTILIPGDIKPPPPPAPIARPLPAPAVPQPAVAAAPAPSAAGAVPPPPPPPPPPPAPTAVVARFIWPVQGPITQGFGVPELGVGAPHTGIDIGLYGRDGTPIAAAAAGTVIFSGGDPCCGYGNYVIIQHPGGFTTLYGHLSSRAVSVGETVTQGQKVGGAGSTGFSTGTHLHFEMHLNGALVSPLNYLP